MVSPSTTSPRSGSDAPSQSRGAQTQNAILAKASRMIADRGIRGLRVEEVAAAAGVSTSLLYYHFKNRAGLVNAAFEYANEQAPSTALRVASDRRSGYEALESALLAELDDAPEVRDYSVVWGDVCANAVFDPDLRAGVRQVTRSWRDTLTGAIERGTADGSIRSEIDAEEAADMLVTLIEGFSVRWLAGSLELARARELLLRAMQTLRPSSAR